MNVRLSYDYFEISFLAEKGYNSVFFFCCFGGPNSAPFALAKKYVFSPILKENSPQNEVLKKEKNRQNVTTQKCV